MARGKKKAKGNPICPVKYLECLAYKKDMTGNWTCGVFVLIDDIKAGKAECKRDIDEHRRAARNAANKGGED